MPLNPNFRQKYESLKRMRKRVLNVAGYAFFFLSLLSFILMLYDLGFEYDAETEKAIHHLNSYLLVIFFVALLNRFLAIVIWKARKSKSRLTETAVLLFFVVALSMRFFMRSEELAAIPWIRFFNGSTFTYMVFVYVFLLEISRRTFKIYHSRFSPALLFIYSFLILIFSGAGLLLLPKASYQGIGVEDALFTATSAVCITGLSVVDVASTFTPFGKKILLMLIQLGGLGVMTFTSFFALLFQKNSSFQNQLFMQNLVNEDKIGETFRTIMKIVIVTLSLEAIGAVFLFSNLDPEMFDGDLMQQAGFAAFHAVSAFCNAGFSLFTDGLYDVRLRYNYNFQLVIAALIILGGLGFPIMFNFYRYLKDKFLNLFYRFFSKHQYKHTPRLLQLNSKIVLTTSAFLLIIGCVLFSITEYNYSLKEHSGFGKLVTAFFGSVTPRTAGFNTVNMATLAPTTILFYLLLMWIGAAPASTGGGIKVTTFAVAFLNILSIAKGRDRLEIMNREIPTESLKRAFGVMFLSFMIIGTDVFLIMLFDPGHDLIRVAFEVFSAFGTVGLSLNLTPDLNSFSKAIIMLTMFLGRVGIITFVIGFVTSHQTKRYQYPAENIIIS
ncbi:TrkH family potassium uptake protein [Adhaeribacter soli]|uniref:ATPase n=1 Tax=Adhaeribacter soli TaxID=2607655 RepID=A0A5N1J168_9BACT|nr:potassium transporter TrkG [Adhaeribacter soli]KAA9340251.1 ATPase [Adhaeribacter soli]